MQQALTVMAEKQQDPAIRRVSVLSRQHLSEGQTLSASFRPASSSFDDLFTSLVAAGEASGSLGGVLSRMAHSCRTCSATSPPSWSIPPSWLEPVLC